MVKVGCVRCDFLSEDSKKFKIVPARGGGEVLVCLPCLPCAAVPEAPNDPS